MIDPALKELVDLRHLDGRAFVRIKELALDDEHGILISMSLGLISIFIKFLIPLDQEQSLYPGKIKLSKNLKTKFLAIIMVFNTSREQPAMCLCWLIYIDGMVIQRPWL